MATTIYQEIKQTRPFSSIREQVVVNLMRTCRKVEELWSKYLKREAGISNSQYNALRILRGVHPKSVKTTEIGDRMIHNDPDVTRLVDRLVKQGLVQRSPDPDDRRVVLVSISKAGLALLERLDGPVLQYTEAAMSGLSEKELREVDVLLNEIRSGIRPFP